MTVADKDIPRGGVWGDTARITRETYGGRLVDHRAQYLGRGMRPNRVNANFPLSDKHMTPRLPQWYAKRAIAVPPWGSNNFQYACFQWACDRGIVFG